MDFIFDLPRMPIGNNGIWTIMYRLSKQAHFIPVQKKIEADHMVKLFMENIFKDHGMSTSIVSDRYPRNRLEHTNSTVLDLLKCYVSEQWSQCENKVPPIF